MAETQRKTHDELDLSTLQKWFYTVVTHPNGVDAGTASASAQELVPLSRDELEHIVTRSSTVSARDRISIYANAYFARLIECLSELFPVLRKTIGNETFGAFAFDYLQHYPSKSYTLTRLGDSFVDYLRQTRPMADPGASAPDWADFLIDLATLEWNIADVFDGPGLEGMTTLQVDLLPEIAPNRWPDIRFKTNPALRLLKFQFPVNEFYTAARHNPEQPSLPAALASYAAINRRDFIVRRHELTRTQYDLLTALNDGQSLGEAIEGAASAENEDAIARDVHRWFRDWTRYQFFGSLIL